MTTEQVLDLVKWLGMSGGALVVIYGLGIRYLEILRSRPASDDQTPKMLAAILAKITDSLEKDAGARLGRMQEISSVLERLAALQLGIAEGSIKSQTATETLHKLTRDRIDQLGQVVAPGLARIESNQVMINETIKKGLEELGNRRAA